MILSRLRRARSRDYYGGILLILVGLACGVRSVAYGLGTLTQIGPGLFPFAVACVLAIAGATIAINAQPVESADAPARFELRGPACIVASLVAFILIGKYGGLLPATFAVVFLSALGDRENRVRDAAILAGAMTGVCLVVFWWLLQVQMPLFQWGGR